MSLRIEPSESTDQSVDQKPEWLARINRIRSAPTFHSFYYRDFRWLWTGTLAAFMAMNMQVITRGWLVLRLADDSPLALALVMMSFALPLAFVAPLGGALADRVSRRHMILLSQSGNVVLTVLLATMDFAGVIAFWHLLVIGFLNGSLMAANMPSRQAIISDVVPEDRLMNAISLNNSGMNLTRILGPAVAGVLIVTVGTAGTFFAVAGVYVVSVLATVMVQSGRTPAASSGRSVAGDVGEALAYARRDPTMLGLIMMAFVPVMLGFSYLSLLPVWAKESLNVQADGLGALMAIMGVGAVIGSVGLASLRTFRRRGVLLLVTATVWGLVLAVSAQTTSYAVAVPFLLLIGLLSSVFVSLNMTLTQVYARPEMRGRIMSISMMSFGMMPLAAVPFGALAEVMGSTPDALTISGLMLAAFTLVVAFAYPHYRRIR